MVRHRPLRPGAVLDGTGIAAQAFDINNSAWLDISGFEVTNYTSPRPAGNAVNIHGSAHHVNLSNLLVHDNWNGIIMQDDANHITIANTTVYHSRYGIGFENTVHDITIDGAVSHDNGEIYYGPVSSYINGDGFSDDAGTYNLTIRNSVAYNNLDAGFDIRAVGFSCTNCISYDNFKYGFRLWDNGGPFTMVDSLAYGNGWFPLQLQRMGPRTYFYNCTFVGRSGDQGYAIDQSGSNVVVRNAIFAGFARRLSNGALTSVDDYSIYAPGPGQVEFALGPHSVRVDPLFADPAAGDYRLQPASPAIDAGAPIEQAADLDGSPRPQGQEYDMGAYEYPSASPGAAPSITAVLNGAAFDRRLAPGAWIAVSGANLALDGVSVSIGGTPAAIASISPGLLKVLAPAALGDTALVPLEVTTPAGTARTSVTFRQFAPAFFMRDTETAAARPRSTAWISATSAPRPQPCPAR